MLISLHAYWLYAFSFDDLPHDDTMRHPIFGTASRVNQLIASRKLTRKFLTDQRQIQESFVERLRDDVEWAEAVEPQHLVPHVRLLQTLDAISLLLSFGGRSEAQLPNIPRRSCEDLVTISIRPAGDCRIVCDPFPFDTDPLPVFLPARVVSQPFDSTSLAMLNLHATPLQSIRFEFVSR